MTWFKSATFRFNFDHLGHSEISDHRGNGNKNSKPYNEIPLIIIVSFTWFMIIFFFVTFIGPMIVILEGVGEVGEVQEEEVIAAVDVSLNKGVLFIN
jgi:hypothetical protein